jgi:hypothetical protein
VETAAEAAMLRSGPDHLPPDMTPDVFPKEEFYEWCRSLKIITKDYGHAPLRMYGTQKYVIEEIAAAYDKGIRDFKILKSRQEGITTILAALDVFWAIKYDGLSAAFMIHEEQAKERFREQFRLYIQTLPASHRLRPRKENRAMMVFPNASIIVYYVAGTKERKVGIGRSGAANYVHASEVAFYGTPDDLKQFGASQSQRYRHRLYIWESTANGFNFWADMCDDARKLPTQHFIFVSWVLNESKRIERDDPLFAYFVPAGDAERMSQRERRGIKDVEEYYAGQVSVEIEQIAWYRWYLQDKCQGDHNMMDQENPWIPDDAFIATGSKYFSGAHLTLGLRRARQIAYTPGKYELGTSFWETDLMPARAHGAEIKIWELPVEHGRYILSCDPAFGSSDTADRTVISVWRCFADCLTQVAEYATNQVACYACAWVLAHLAGAYADCFVILEVAGPGQTVQNELDRLRIEMARGTYEETRVLEKMKKYIYRRADSLSGTGGHWQPKMTYELRQQIIGGLKDAFETNILVINSVSLLDEMKTIVVRDGNFYPQPHCKDDRVISAAYAVRAWQTDVRPQMIAEGRTKEKELNPETAVKPPGPEVATVMNYIRQLKIGVPGVPQR